jgi:peptidoglycan/LPS O-acetylase OafA/YrhL
MPFLLSQLIEAARWLGALLIVLLHTNNMFINQADIMSAPHPAPAYVWWFLAAYELGHQAVVGFFVISGWLVGGAAIEKTLRGQDYLRDYFIHRFSRIYLVLIPALLLTLALDGAGRALFSDAGVYDWPLFQGHFSATLFFANCLSLQGIAADFFGTNGPLWSLACEFWYYITFPLLLLPFTRTYTPAVRFGGFTLGLVLTLALAAPEKSWFGFGFLLWAMGAAASRAPRPLIGSRWLSLGIYAATVTIIRLLVRAKLVAAHPGLDHVADVVSAALLVNLLLAFRDAPQEGFSALRWKIHAPLANFSFSLYAVHMPLAIFARAGAGHFLGRDWPLRLATFENYAAAIVVILAASASAYGFSRLTEANTGAARRALRRSLDRVMPSPAQERAAAGS